MRLVDDKEIISKPIKIPVRVSFVPPPEDDFASNPPFEASDFKEIDEAYQKWVLKKDGSMDRKLKEVIYTKFLIDCSVGWRPYSEGCVSKWSWIQEIYEEVQKIKDKDHTFRNVSLRILIQNARGFELVHSFVDICSWHFLINTIFMQIKCLGLNASDQNEMDTSSMIQTQERKSAGHSAMQTSKND